MHPELTMATTLFLMGMVPGLSSDRVVDGGLSLQVSMLMLQVAIDVKVVFRVLYRALRV